MVTGRLLATIAAATKGWGIEFGTIDHMLWPDVEPIEEWGSAAKADVERLLQESSLYSQ